MKIDFVVKDSPRLSNPVVVCGLPGSAFVGKFAVDHLVSELDAKPLAEIYSDSFPPQVLIKDDSSTTLLKNDLYYYQGKNGRRDIILYTGDAQPSDPEGEYILSERVVDFVQREHGAKELITLGAYVTGSFPEMPKVYAAASDKNLARQIEKMGSVLMTDGGITGMNGLLLGLAKLKGMNGFTILGETSGYVFDAKASQAVLVFLGRLIGIDINPEKLEQRVKESQELVKAVEKLQRQQAQETAPEKKRLGYIS